MVYFPQVLNLVACPVEGCSARDHTPGRLQQQFMCQHVKAKLAILKEGSGPLPWCPIFGMHMHAEKMTRHQRTYRCNRATEMQLWKRDMEISQREGEMKFRFHNREDDPLSKGVRQFQYLGKTLGEIDSDCLVVHHNISKVWEVWRRLVNLLQWEGADRLVSFLFCRVAIQTVLLFGLESWAM